MEEQDHPDCLAIVLARSDSSRLPGKVLTDLGGGFKLLDLVVRRLAKSTELKRIVLATTSRAVDDELSAYAEANLNLAVHRGAAEDVAGRALACARRFGAGLFVRVNADSPFVDPGLIDEGIRLARESGADLTTNLASRSYPYGVAVEVIRTDCYAVSLPAFSVEEREHVSQFFYRHPDRFHICSLPLCPIPGLTSVRLTVDDQIDLDRVRRLVGQLGISALTADYASVAALASRA